MEQALQQIGLNAKEVKFYLFLLREGQRTGTELAEAIEENRTNTYMVLNKLVEEGLVEFDGSLPVRVYEAANPEKLKTLLTSRQQQLRQANSGLNSVLPELSSLFTLTQHKPGVVYFEGLEGYRTYQEDSLRENVPIDILASNVVPENKEALKILQEAVSKRSTKDRIIFHNDARNWLDVAGFEARGYQVRFWGEMPLEGEIAIYGNKVGVTAYSPALIVTLINNEIIAKTFRTIFNQLWQSADSHS